MRRRQIGSMLHEFNAGAPSRRETKTAGQRDKNLTPRRRGNTEKYLFEISGGYDKGCGDGGSVQCFTDSTPGRRAAGKNNQFSTITIQRHAPKFENRTQWTLEVSTPLPPG